MANRLASLPCQGERRFTSSLERAALPCLLEDLEHAASMISEMNASSYATLSEELAQSFPHSAQSFLDSAPDAILSCLNTTLSEIDQHSRISNVNIDECWRAVVLARPVLQEIAKMSSQTDRGTGPNVRGKPFTDIGVEVPSSMEEISQLESGILKRQKDILKCYLALLRRPDVVQDMRQYFEDKSARSSERRHSTHSMPHEQIPNTSTTTPVTASASEDHSTTSTYATLRPAKALFYFEAAEGFGEWHIYISASATTEFRKLRKRRPVLFDTTVAKIRELSHGDFSTDNHVLLSDTESAVPIFKARFADDSRLVYSVDCVPDLDADVNRQAIRILGVYSHAQLYRRTSFWNDLARDLGRQGEAYRDRCRQRSQPRNESGKHTYSPITFPKLPEPTTGDGHAFLLPTDSAEADAMGLFSMHRILILSKALLNSFLAELEIPFMAHPSPSETEIIEHDTSCFVVGRSGTGKTWTMMYKIIAIMRGWELWDPERAKPRIMFVTRSSMLAHQVHRTTIQLLEAFRLGSVPEDELARLAEQRAQSTETLGGERRRGLPKEWSALEDKHFPLFVTIEELYSMLEANLAPSTRAGDDDDLDIDTGDESLLSSVSGNRFVKTYWSHFSRSLTKGLDPMSIFSEFLGVIKGSEETVGTKDGHLTRTAYTSLRVRSYPTFASQRDGVYRLFEAYQRLKRDRRERDGADRTHALLRRLDSARIPGLPVEFLFVDEVQDNLIIDMLLLRSLCNNPNGLFWAGDTAQTIAVGSSFTFNELKSMMHRLERRQASPLQIPPATFHLAVNFRSHSGIANCAQTVVDLLTSIWPDSLDRLGPEHGWRAGPKPVFFGSSGMDQLTLFERQYTRTSKLQLGSEQCIIVRDEEARGAFLSRGIASGLVITIYQSKGLEFDDVFLYHLFEDSPITLQQWRTLCERMDKVTVVWAEESRSICRELKMLYVALTRARQRLWIVDGSEKALPMMDFWTRREVVETNIREDVPLSLAGHSSSDNWANQGKQFMDKREFDLAAQCFESAHLPLECDIAKAYLLHETADSPSEHSLAAEAFGACANMVSGERAKKLLLASAACHQRAGNWAKSAASYHDAGEFTKCVRQYTRAGMMEDARQVILCHRNEVGAAVLKRVCMHFFDINERSKAIDMFSNTEEAVDFMKAHELYRALALCLRDLQRVREAAEIYLHYLHDVPNAVELFFHDPEDGNMVALGTRELLEDLWLRLSIGRKVDLHSQHAVLPLLLLLASRRLSMSNLSYDGDKEAEIELSLFVAIAEKNVEQLLRLGLQFSQATSNRDDQAIVALSLDFAFTYLLDERAPLEPDTLSSTPSLLPAFGIYTKVSTDYANAAIWKAYGIRKVSGKRLGLYTLPRVSLLYDTAIALAVVGTTQSSNNEGEVDISLTGVIRLLRAEIGARVRRRTFVVNAACQRLDILRLCISYAFTGACPRSSHAACLAEHCPIGSDSHPLDEHGLHLRLRICAQMIVVYDPLVCGSADDARDAWNARLHWIDSFLATIYVPFFELGSLLMFMPDPVPEFKDACRVLRSWISEILFTARPHRSGKSGKISGTLRIHAIPRTALLSYVLDRVDDHLRDATSHRQAMPTPPFLWYTASYEILTKKLTEYSREHESSHHEMPGALLYLRFLLDRGEIHFHRGIMAHLAEGLCAAFILSDRARKSLHNLVLSRRWLVNLANLWTASHEVQSHDRDHVWGLIDLFPELLERLWMAEGEAAMSGGASNVVVDTLDSLCKALFHLGFWHIEFKNWDTKSRILNILMGISKDCPKPPYLYVIEENHPDYWDALRKAIVSSGPPRSRERDQQVQVQVAASAKQDKAYASTPFQRSWLQERPQESPPPPPAVHAQDDVSERSTQPADCSVIASSETVQAHKPPLAAGGPASNKNTEQDVTGVANEPRETD